MFYLQHSSSTLFSDSGSGIEVEKANLNVLCVVLSVRVWCMCCGSVRLIVVVELVYGEA